MKDILKKTIIIAIIALFILSANISAIGIQLKKQQTDEEINILSYSETKYIELDFVFSDLEIVPYQNYSVVRVNETNHNKMIMFNYDPGKPVLPVNISVFNLAFGSKIIDVNYENSTPEIYDVPNKLAFCKATVDNQKSLSINTMDASVYESANSYPLDWASYHTGGGLLQGDHTTFLVLRVHPVRYFPTEDKIHFIQTITINISYMEPAEPIFKDTNLYDLLIITPKEFAKDLQPLVEHKNLEGVKTKLVTTCEVYDETYWEGRDQQEKIKYFIKNSIEQWGITHVLLVGGIKGQSTFWNLPVRYSYVVPMEEQEYPETSFISDLYYADIYDGEGDFSSWDSNGDNQFSVWNNTCKDEMDLYPDVYLGRLVCRNKQEVKTMVNKIVNYEKSNVKDKDWFKNVLLVGGDSYPTGGGRWPKGSVIKEGEIACDTAMDNLPGFNPLKVYTTDNDINQKIVNLEFNKGASFAYFCGHGSSASWSTHFPDPIDDSTNWTTGYGVKDMIPLRNKEKLPVTVVGGCHNGEFDKTIPEKIIEGIKENGLKYFVGRFWFDGWNTKCWSWWLTSKANGGSIATISNTGLGTHGDGDQDNNSVVDYIEILDGWLELRFLELYGKEQRDILGENHGDTLTGYLHRFLDDGHKMDVKMVQQWALFGDPSLKIGGYE